MDTFDAATAASLSAFDASGDAHSFVDYFQQQQENQSQQQQQQGNHYAAQYQQHQLQQQQHQQASLTNSTDDSSSTSTLLRQSTSPSSRNQSLSMAANNAAGMQTDSASTTVDSPSSMYFAMQTSSSTSSVGGAPMAGKAAAAGVGSPHSLHPMNATPVRHNSLPFEQQQQQQFTSLGRPIAGPSSRQLSMGAVGGVANGGLNGLNSSPASPHMRPPVMMASTQEGQGAAASSPTGSDFLNPNSSISQSPSPLRTSIPFTTSPDHSTTTSPTTLKHEEGFSAGRGSSPNRSHTMPSPSLQQTPGAHIAGRSNSQSVTASGSEDKNASSTKFVHKLFRMVSDPEYQHLISWNASGTSVVVTNFDEFSKEVLGKHFKHSNFSSFIRQLNMYGFYKVNKTPRGQRHTVETQVWEFSHPKFIRGRQDLLDEIRRKALDSEHARVEARDLHYNVSVGHMQLRQQVDEHQYRLEEMFEVNLALRQMVIGLRDSLSNVMEWVKANNGGQLPFENRMPMAELPPTPMMHPFMAERPSPMPNTYYSPNPGLPSGMLGQQDMMGQHSSQGDGGPSIFVTEPGFGQGPGGAPQDVFSMHAMGQVSPMASRRPSNSSQASERMDRNDAGPPHMTIDTSLAAAAAANGALMGMGNPGLGVMGLGGGGPMNGEMQMAINTPLPPSPAVQQHSHSGGQSPYATMENSPFLATSPSMPTFANQGYFAPLPPPQQQQQQHIGGYGQHHPSGMPGNGVMTGSSGEEDNSMLIPNAKAMRTQMKRTASNAGSQQMMMDAASALNAGTHQQQKRKSPGL